jgi:iron(III) transport system substrate-binding protein
MNAMAKSRIFFRAGIGVLLGCAGALSTAPTPTQAQGALVLYCSVQEEWCRPMANAFERATGVRVAMSRKSAGETYAQIKAEASNPRGDIWWGGTGDPHMQAAEENLTIDYKSSQMGELQDWAVRQWEQSKGRTIGIYSGALGYGYNIELVKKKSLAEPKCWTDLRELHRQLAHLCAAVCRFELTA